MRERTVETKRIFKGRLLKIEKLTVELEAGTRASREIIRHRGAVAVLGRLPDKRYVLVRQYRKPIERELIEVIAGCLEPGEALRASAIREVGEETGFAVRKLVTLGPIYPTPGYCDEIIHCFFAELTSVRTSHVPDADERVQPVFLSGRALAGLIERGRIRDAKTLVVWWKYRAWQRRCCR